MLVFEQIIDLYKELLKKLAIDNINKPLDELWSVLLEDHIAVIFHFLIDIMDEILSQLINFAEFSEASLDDEFQSNDEELLLFVSSEGHHALNHVGE